MGASWGLPKLSLTDHMLHNFSKDVVNNFDKSKSSYLNAT